MGGKIYDYVDGGTGEDCGEKEGLASAARAVRRRRPVQPVAPVTAASKDVMGLSSHQADVLFDFFVEHSVNGNQEDRQLVLKILEERAAQKRENAKQGGEGIEENEGGGAVKRQRI